MSHLSWRDLSEQAVIWLLSVDFSPVNSVILPPKLHQLPAVRWQRAPQLCLLKESPQYSQVVCYLHLMAFTFCAGSQGHQSLLTLSMLLEICHISPLVPLAHVHVPNQKILSSHQGSLLLASSESFPALLCPF